MVEEGLRGITTPSFSLEYDAAIAAVHNQAHGGQTAVADIRKTKRPLNQLAGKYHHHSSPPCVAASKLQAYPSEVSKEEETEFGRIFTRCDVA